MKKALSLLLALLMLVSLLAVPVSAGDDDGFNDGQFDDWGNGTPDSPDTPDEPVEGSKENPYYITKPAAVPTTLELAAGTCVYYQFPALKFNGWTITGFALTGIEVNGVMNTELSLVDRAIKITLSNDGDLVGFYNDSEEDVIAVLTLEEPLGTSDSPYRLEAGETAITIPEIHYEYYAEYTTEVVGEYTFDVSDYANFEVYFDANRYDSENELVQLTEALTLQLEAGTPVAFILRPVGGIFDVTLFVTAPAKGTEQNPYYLSSYDQVKAGVNELGDAMWPATMDGVHYTLDGYAFNGTTLVVTGKAPLSVMVNGTNWTKAGESEITMWIPLELSEDNWSFSVIIKSAADVKVDVVFPEGTYENPLEMNKGKNTLSLDDMGNPYYATYTAEKDGVLVLKPNTVNGLGYTDVSNLTSGDPETGYDYIYSDPEGENSSPDNVLKIQVSKGDVVLVSACACENDDFEILAMDLVLTLSYEGDVTIVKEPSTGYAKMGDKVTVKITAEGEGLTYTWHIKNAGSSKYSKSSVTKASYSVTMTDKVKDRLVFCRVYDADGNMVHQSKTVRLREAVSVTKEPSTGYAKMGATVKVTVKASGDGLKYTWYIKNSGASKYSKSSVTTATYSTTMSSKSKDRLVYCVVTDKYGKEVKSKTVRLRESVSVTSVPATAIYAKNGATAKVAIKASGDGLKYTWYIKNANGTKYSKSSITSATYSAKMSNSVNGRRVYCVVTDKYGNVVQTKTFILKKK